MESRARGNIVRTAIDIAILMAAFWISFLIRLDGHIPFELVKRAAFTTPYVVALQFGLLVFGGITRFAWRYVGMREARGILTFSALAGVSLGVVRFGAELLVPVWGYFIYAEVPWGVIAIDFMLAFLGVSGVRFLRRALGEAGVPRSSPPPAALARTLLVGAGSEGVQVAKEISRRHDLGIRVVGFVDDDAGKLGQVIDAIAVLGSTRELAAIARRVDAAEALLCLGRAPGAEVRRIKLACDEAGIRAKIIPSMSDIVAGRVNLSAMREVTIEDLLGRDTIRLDADLIEASVVGRAVLISGAGGSIGSELCRQVCRYGPEKLLLLERAENNLFQIHRELCREFPEVRTVPCIGDVCDAERMEALFAKHRPNVVFHAAAHKHVPLMEAHPGEAIKNNVFGTKTLADTALRHRAERFVMISTDKAVNPTSVMGASKRVAELYVQGLAQTSATRFVTVRFGNVLGSVGSVIPIFKEQIARGGPVTVTHPEMRRYFMTIPEACQLVLQAGAMGQGGEIFVLDMGEPVRIVDLAHHLIRLSGLQPDQDIDVVFTGIRPGEKLFEELATSDEQTEKTRHPKIFIGKVESSRLRDVLQRLLELKECLCEDDPERVREMLAIIVPEYRSEFASVRTSARMQEPQGAHP